MPGENVENNQDLYKPIPAEIAPVAGWKEVPLKEGGEPLVPIGSFVGNDFDRIFTSSIYYGERQDSPYGRESLVGSLVTTFARKEVAEQLLKVESSLPPGQHIIVYDSYRPLEVQQSIYDQYFNALKQKHPDWTDEQLSDETQRFVSIPSTNPDRPSPHNTGGSIDVAIYRLPDEIEARVSEINNRVAEIGGDVGNAQEVYELEMERIGLIAKHAELLDFGTQWDWGGPEAALNYYEVLSAQRELTEKEQVARDNRRLLYNLMVNVGFEPYADEWWHYNSKKSQMGAKTAGLPMAEYGAAQLSEENRKIEEIRKLHLKGSEILSKLQGDLMDKFGRQPGWFDVAVKAAKEMGDPSITTLPKAAKIHPPQFL